MANTPRRGGTLERPERGPVGDDARRTNGTGARAAAGEGRRRRRGLLPLLLGALALLPALALAAGHITNFPFAGTTLLIAVGVALETMKQIDSQLMMRNYEGFLK